MKQEVIDKLTEKALSYLNSVEAFTAKEVPEYLKELLEFKFVEHLVEYFTPLAILLCLLICSLILSLFLLKNDLIEFKKRECTYLTAHSMPTSFIPFILSSVFGILFLLNIMDYHLLIKAYKIKKAPRVYLIDYLRQVK